MCSDVKRYKMKDNASKDQRRMERTASDLLESSLRKEKTGWKRVVNRERYNEARRVAEQLVKQCPRSRIGWEVLWKYYWLASMKDPHKYGGRYRRAFLKYIELTKEYSKADLSTMKEEMKFADAVDYNRNGNPDLAFDSLVELSDQLKHVWDYKADLDLNHVLLEQMFSLCQLKKWKALVRLSFQFEEKDRYCLPARYYYLQALLEEQGRYNKDWIFLAESSVNTGLQLYPDDIKLCCVAAVGQNSIRLAHSRK